MAQLMWQADLHGFTNLAQTIRKCMQLLVLLRARHLICPIGAVRDPGRAAGIDIECNVPLS